MDKIEGTCFDSKLTELKFGHSEKNTKFEKIFHLKFDVTQQCQILIQILCSSQNVQTLPTNFEPLPTGLGWVSGERGAISTTTRFAFVLDTVLRL